MKKIEFKKFGIFFVLIALMAIFSIASPVFLSATNILNIIRQVSMIGIAAVGSTFVILTGGIDLSVGSQVTFVNIVCAYLMVKLGFPPVISVFISIAIASCLGLIIGLMITKIKMPPFIVTLGFMSILSGAALIISKGLPIFGFPKSFSILGQGYLWLIPIPIIIMIVFIGIGSFVLNKTYFGRYLYAIGGNEEASELSGINVSKIKTIVYALNGMFAGIAGVIMLSRTNSGQPTTGGGGFLFDVMTAVILGGVSIMGGSGAISGVIAGVLIMGVLSNGLVLMNTNVYLQDVVKGLVLLLAVAFDCIQKNRAYKEGKTIKSIKDV